MPKAPKQPVSSNSKVPVVPPSEPSPNQRLPVNPRRKKVAPDQRKRVATACNRCNQKRIKCSGEKPCRQCSNAVRECIYPPPIEKVTIPRTELEQYQATIRHSHVQECRLRALELLLEERGIPLPPDPVQTPPPDSEESAVTSPVENGTVEVFEVQEERDQGKLLTDSYGTERFLGETSGANFLDDCKSFIVISHTVVCGNRKLIDNSLFHASRGRYQTFDSRPMNLPSVDPLWLPPHAEMEAMLNDVSIYLGDGNGSFRSGGIFYWPWKDLVDIVPTSPKLQANRQLALYHVAFAFSSLLKGQPSDEHFARAYALMGSMFDVTAYTLDDVPTMSLMALYLVENNRRDAAYICISHAAHVSIMHGAHRQSWNSDSAVDEGRKRSFWTVYILDRWLSCLMGRPPTIPENAVNLLLPEKAPGLPSPVGLKANIGLAEISHRIVQHSYSPYSPQTFAADVIFTLNITAQLDRWKDNLPANIQLDLSKALDAIPKDPYGSVDEEDESDPAGILGSRGLDRALLSLHMMHNQLYVLAIRPVFLSAVKKLVSERYHNPESDLAINPHHPLQEQFRERGVGAARHNLVIGLHIKNYIPAPGNKLLVADLHHIFNAAVILILYRIAFTNLRTHDAHLIASAREVFAEEAKAASEYGRDCLAVLTEMEHMVDELRNIIHYPHSMREVYGEDPEYQRRFEQFLSWTVEHWKTMDECRREVDGQDGYSSC